VYPDERIVGFVTRNFVPVKAHIKEQRATFDRFGASWTPTQLILDSDGAERHRIEGFLPVEDFLAQLELGLGKLAFEGKNYTEAEHRFRSVCDEHPKAGAAPEACYWAGVSAYKATNVPDPLRKTAGLLSQRYPESEWARKASVWSG
jgi:hypothetical protein